MVNLSRNEDIKNIIEGEKLTIIQYGSVDCAPCTSIKQRIDQWLLTHQKVDNRYVPIEDFRETAAQNNIFTVPSTLLYYDGKEIIRKSGYYSLDEILDEAEKIISMF